MFWKKPECHKLRKKLSPYIDGELSPAEKAMVEHHVEQCDACHREMESLRATVGLLQQVPMVATPRSFTIAARAPRRYPAALGALRVATAAAVLVLAFVFIGDAAGFLGAPSPEEMSLRQDLTATAVPPPDGESPGEDDVRVAGEYGAQGRGDTWSLRHLQLALTGVVVVLGGTTAIVWLRLRREQEKAVEASVEERRDTER